MILPKGWGKLPAGRMRTLDRMTLELRKEGHAVQTLNESINVLRVDEKAHKQAISLLSERKSYHQGRVLTLKKQLDAYRKEKL